MYIGFHVVCVCVRPSVGYGDSAEVIWPWATRCCISGYWRLEARNTHYCVTMDTCHRIMFLSGFSCCFAAFRYTWFTLEALEESWQNLQRLIKVCRNFLISIVCMNSDDIVWCRRETRNWLGRLGDKKRMTISERYLPNMRMGFMHGCRKQGTLYTCFIFGYNLPFPYNSKAGNGSWG